MSTEQLSLRWTSAINSLRRVIMAPRYNFERAYHPGGRQLLVDVSTIIKADGRTGIQRVVRALLGQLVRIDIPGVTVQPVFASRDHGFCKALFLNDGSLVNAGTHPSTRETVKVNADDIFLGLDLAAQTLPAVERQLAGWRHLGVSINIIVYDLLPSTHPDWFPSRLVRRFRKWTDIVARQSDRCICISRTVAQTLRDQLARSSVSRLPEISSIPLGSDIAASYPSSGLPSDYSILLKWIRQRRTALAVGTIEPRKGHEQLLDAFDHIWQSDKSSEIALLVVGRPGWRTKRLQKRILNHPERGARLMWLDQVSDQFLTQIYGSCAGLIAASYQEGFGLPLLEAAANGAPVLARDTPIFREVGGSLFDYFQDENKIALANTIVQWVSSARPTSREALGCFPSWRESAEALLDCLQIKFNRTEF